MKFHSPFLFATATAAHLIGGAAASDDEVDDGISRCGTAEPNDARKAELNEAYFARLNDEAIVEEQSREVDVYVHVVSSAAKRNQYTREMVLEQIAVMNDAYQLLGVTFLPVAINFTVNDAWASAPQDSPLEEQMKASLRRGTYADLNLYFTSDLPNGLLGFCYFPVTSPSNLDKVLDGCVCHAGSMPRGSMKNYNLGMTAVHEVGHWFGLYHVFQGASCQGLGDYVDDTPMQRAPTSGCPRKAPHSCPRERGGDSIHNFMDYSWDACLEEFTEGQVDRAVSIYGQMRSGFKESSPPFGNFSRRSY